MAKASPECMAAGYAECWTERLCACPCHTASCLTAFPGLKCGFKAVTPAPRSPLAIFRSSWHTLSPQLCTYGSRGSSVLQDASFSASRARRALLSQSPGWFPATGHLWAGLQFSSVLPRIASQIQKMDSQGAVILSGIFHLYAQSFPPGRSPSASFFCWSHFFCLFLFFKTGLLRVTLAILELAL